MLKTDLTIKFFQILLKHIVAWMNKITKILKFTCKRAYVHNQRCLIFLLLFLLICVLRLLGWRLFSLHLIFLLHLLPGLRWSTLRISHFTIIWCFSFLNLCGSLELVLSLSINLGRISFAELPILHVFWYSRQLLYRTIWLFFFFFWVSNKISKLFFPVAHTSYSENIWIIELLKRTAIASLLWDIRYYRPYCSSIFWLYLFSLSLFHMLVYSISHWNKCLW